MTISSLEATVDQQQRDEQQQQFEHLAEQLENNNKKKKPTVNTKTKRVGGYNNRYNQGVSRYNNQQQYYPYVYYYSPQSPYYPTAVDAASPNINITTRDDEDLEIIMHDESSTIHNTSPDQHKIPDLKKQLEYYFSRQNLVNDTFLVSQMDSDLYVPISLIANFKRVREWTTDINVIVSTLRESSAVTVDDSGTRVKPNISLERSTVILRDVPECTEEEITNYLKEIDVPSVQSMKKDIGNLWYFTFESESDALRLFNNVKGKPFKNQTLAARMKSEPALRVQTRTAATPSSNHSINAIVEQGNEYPYTGFYYPYQNAYQNNRRNSNTRSFNNRSPNKSYYNNQNQNNNRQQQQQQQNEYHKTSPVGGRSARGGYKSKNYNRSPRSPTTNDDNDTNGLEYKSRIDTQDTESGVSNLSLQPNEDGARKQSYYNQKQRQRPYNQQNKPYKSSNGESSLQQASTTSDKTSTSNDTKRYNNTRNYNRNHNNDTRNDTESIGDNARRHSNDNRSYGDNTRRHSNDTRGYNNNRSYSNDTRTHSNEDINETRNQKNNADKPRKKFYKNNNNSQDVSLDQKKKHDQDASEQLTATHFPPLPNQQAETDIAQTMPEAGLTRSVADIVKSSVQTKKDEKTNTVKKQPLPEPTKEEEEAFPILCQTTEFRTNSSSYADILKK